MKTNSGIRKTLTVKNADNDVVGIRVTPTRKQYTSEAGGQAWYVVSLKSQPLDTIVLRWAITNGKNSVDIVANRVMTFLPSQWNSSQVLKIQGKVCGDCEEHTAVMVESQNIISVNGTDADYPALSPESISLTNLKLGPVMTQTNAASNNTVTVTFNNPIFATVDDAYIYETVFETETIAMTYAPYQSRPVLIKNSCTDSNGNIRTTVTSTTVTDPLTQIQTTTYSHSFCLSFYHATASRTQAGMNNWYGAGTVSCSGNGGTPNLATCNFSGSGTTPGSNTIPANTIFNEYTGNSAIGLVFDTTPGSGSAQIIPDAYYQANQPTVSLSYKPLSVVEGSYTAQFRSAVPMASGFWYLSGFSKSLLKEGGDYSPARYFYIYVP